MSKKKLSIIIPCFNSYQELSSLLSKIYSIFKIHKEIIEILIIDDFSNKKNLKLKESLSCEFIHVSFINNILDKGVGGSRNTGIIMSKGDYLYFVDADDLIDIKGIIDTTLMIDTFSTKLDLIFAQNNVSSFSNKITLPPINKEIIIKEIRKDEIENTIVNFCNYPRNYSYYPHCWNKFYRKSFVLKHKINFDMEFNQLEDVEFVGNCVLNSTKIAIINEILYTHCLAKDNRLSKSLFFPKDIVNLIKSRLIPTGLILEKSNKYGAKSNKIISRAVGNHCALFFVRVLNFLILEKVNKKFLENVQLILRSDSYIKMVKNYIPNKGEDFLIKYFIIFKIDIYLLIFYWKSKLAILRFFSKK